MNKMVNIHAAKVVFYGCLITAIGLIIGGFLVPPTGVIDGSVLQATAILLAFAALGIFGRALDNNKIATFKKGDAELVVGENTDNQ